MSIYHSLTTTFIRTATDLLHPEAGALFLGVELEVVGPDLPASFNAAPWPTSDRQRLIGIKDDSSVYYGGEYGPEVEYATSRSNEYNDDDYYDDEDDHVGTTSAELYTQPFGPAYYTRYLKNGLTRLLTHFQSARVGCNDTCGMHVHVSRSAFADQAHEERFARLFYRYPGFAFWLSGRRCRSLMDQWAPCEQARTVEQVRSQLRLGLRRAVSRTRKNTLEIRIFGGTTDVGQFHANIQSVMAGVAFSRDITFDDVVPATWRAWVAERAEEYPELAARLATYYPPAARSR